MPPCNPSVANICILSWWPRKTTAPEGWESTNVVMKKKKKGRRGRQGERKREREGGREGWKKRERRKRKEGEKRGGERRGTQSLKQFLQATSLHLRREHPTFFIYWIRVNFLPLNNKQSEY